MTTTTEPTEAPVEPPAEPFHLIADATGEEKEGMIPLMWCVQPDTAAWLVDHDISEPQLLISVISDSGDEEDVLHRYTEMDRYIVPLKAGLEYIRFRRAGTNLVKATIVWGDSRRTLKKFFLAKEHNNRFVSSVLDYEGNVKKSSHPIAEYDKIELGGGRSFTGGGSAFTGSDGYAATLIRRHDHITEMTFAVSPDIFGKPSPKWETQYFSKFTSKSVDECARRGRRLALWPLLPFFFAFQAVVRFGGYAGSAFIGFYNLDASPLTHFFSTDIAGIWSNVGPKDDGLFWFKKKRENDSGFAPDRAIPFIVMNPLSITVLWGLIAFIANISVHDDKTHQLHPWAWSMAWWQSLGWSIVIHLFVLLMLGVVFVGVGIVNSIADSVTTSDKRAQKKAARRKRRQDKEDAWKTREIDALKANLATMSCESIPKQVGIGSVPKERRTRHMQIQKLKSQVCRPFQA